MIKTIQMKKYNNFEIEISRFTERVFKTLFLKEIKKVILTIDFNLDEENHNKSKFK